MKKHFILAVLTAFALLTGNTAFAAELSQPKYKMIVEKDVRIPTRDGSYLAADIYRPDAPGETFPPMLSLSVYQKELQYIPHQSPFTHQERPEPEWWASRGYVLIFIDSRGTGRSPGDTDVYGMQETRDYYDAIEWAAVQPWSNGKVGLNGVSYYAVTQWNVASLQPPSLAAIVPWEGYTDYYRDRVYTGGLFNQDAIGRWWMDVRGKQLLEHTRIDNVGSFNENLMYKFMVNYLDGPWWNNVKSRAQLDKITVPFYSVGNWTSWNLHLRGNVEAFEKAASKNKKLRVHIGSRLWAYYSDEGKTDLLRFYDHWLKGIDTGIMKEPPVKLCIRVTFRDCKWRFENEFPLKRTQYTKFYLTPDSAGGVVKGSLNDVKLSATAPKAPGQITYDAGPESDARARRLEPGASFVTDPLTEDTEITGHVNLVMWVSSDTTDMDIFANLRKINADGTMETVGGGVLKVSHRKIDPKKSTPFLPYLVHDEEQILKPGEIVPVQVEIKATSMVYQKGTRIRLDVMPHNGSHYFAAYHHTGNNHIYTGGDMASYVLLPVIPPRSANEPDMGSLTFGNPPRPAAN